MTPYKPWGGHESPLPGQSDLMFRESANSPYNSPRGNGQMPQHRVSASSQPMGTAFPMLKGVCCALDHLQFACILPWLMLLLAVRCEAKTLKG